MKKLFYSMSIVVLVLASCVNSTNSESNPSNDAEIAQAAPKQSKSVPSNNSKEKLNEILDFLNASLFNKCVSFPLIIESPYAEFPNAGTVGGIYFGGSNLEMNKQYAYFSNQNAQLLDQKSWSTERGDLSNIKLESKKYNGIELPIITGIWKSKQNTQGNVMIRPIISGENIGKFYYRMYTNSWEVYGYKVFSKNDFIKALQLMCEMASLDMPSVDFSSVNCNCLMNAEDESEIQECAPDKSMEELMQMVLKCIEERAKDLMDEAMDNAKV